MFCDLKDWETVTLLHLHNMVDKQFSL